MALHGAALERILDLASKLGEAGETLLQKCGSDELVSSVLLLYGLHPEGLHSRVAYALEKSRTFLASHGARAELLSCGEDGIRVRLHLKANGCGSSGATVKSTLEAALQDAAPDAAAILVEEAASAVGSGFVPVGQLSGNMAAALSGSRTPGSGD
jgi:Fe-S cluster biogenesis protein NfuA